MELRRLELEMARELSKPNEDMCLSDHKVTAAARSRDRRPVYVQRGASRFTVPAAPLLDRGLSFSLVPL